MNATLTPHLLGAALLAASLPACGAFDPGFGYVAGPPDAGGGGVSFARDLRPLLDRSQDDPTGRGCKFCHYSTASEHVGYDLGGLDLATLGALRMGGATSGDDIVVPGKPDESVIVQKLEGTYPFGAHMPRSAPPYWSAADIGQVKTWIAEGAKGADDE